MAIMSKESLEPEDGIITKDVRKKMELEYAELINKFDEKYQSSELKNDSHYMSPEVKTLTDADTSGTNASWFYQFGLLSRRNFLNLARIPNTSYVKVITTILTAVLCIVLFYNSEDTAAGI